MSIYESRDLNLDSDTHRYDDLFVDTPEVTTIPQEKKVKKSSPKQKFGENGSYFDPETKRTYYKDPQYQKAYDDEWNRLEKLYKMKQEEQRRIERENFQRVLAQADALTKSMQSLGYRNPLPWEQKNRFDGSEGSKIERNTQGGEALTQRRYYQDGDYTGYTRDNGNPVAFDEEGNLIDQVTGEKGTMLTGTPDVEAIGEKKRIGIPMTSPSAPIPLSGILSPSTEDYLKAADNTASAFSAAKWMDTAYDAMYTPDEINMPWDEGNKGLGNPVLDFGFDFATGLGLAKLANLSRGIDALYNGVNNAKRVDRGVGLVEDNIYNSSSYNGILKRTQRNVSNFFNYGLPQTWNYLTVERPVLKDLSRTKPTYFSQLAKRNSELNNFYSRLTPQQQSIVDNTPVFKVSKADKGKGSFYRPSEHAIYMDTSGDFLTHKSKQGVMDALTHEYAHALQIAEPTAMPDPLDIANRIPNPKHVVNTPVPKNISQLGDYWDVYSDYNNAKTSELAARGTQLKNAAGFKAIDDKFTMDPEKFRDFVVNYAKTRMDNEFTERVIPALDKGNKQANWTEFRDYVNKVSYGLLPLSLGAMTYSIDKNTDSNKK